MDTLRAQPTARSGGKVALTAVRSKAELGAPRQYYRYDRLQSSHPHAQPEYRGCEPIKPSAYKNPIGQLAIVVPASAGHRRLIMFWSGPPT